MGELGGGLTDESDANGGAARFRSMTTSGIKDETT
jgi:hypothetical protein